MTSNAAGPSLPAVQAALRRTTEHFANELARPSQARPDWSDFEWCMARAVAAMHGISPLLATTLRWQGPAEWQTFLDEQRQHTERRQQRIQALLRLIDDNTRVAGIPAIALKGAALHSLGLFRAGERPMADVDLLVREQDFERTSRLLEGLGYHETHSSWRHRSFTPADATLRTNLGEHADNYLKIELHERICEPLPVKITTLSHFLADGSPAPGLNPYPSNAALMAHLLLHAAGSMVKRSLRLINLHDIALLARRMPEDEWVTLAQWWALPPLLLTAHYYAGAIPTSALQAIARHCPRHLRWSAARVQLTDVSLSRLWVEAFPGIGWARSAGEAARYMADRIRPGSAAMSQRKALAASEPGHAGSTWAHLNQGARILRWLTSRPPRPASMYAVRASLDLHAWATPDYSDSRSCRSESTPSAG